MARAAQTAAIITLERKLAVKTIEALRERSITKYLQKFPGKNREIVEEEIIKALENLDEKAKSAYKHTDDFDSSEEAAVRLITFLRETAVAYSGKTILIVSHGNLMRATLTHLGWAKYDELPKRAIDNIGYFVLESDGIDFFVKETFGVTKYKHAKRGW